MAEAQKERSPLNVHSNNPLNSHSKDNQSESARRSLEEQLNEMLQVLFELSVVVYDFQPEGNKLVWDKINSIIDHYQKMDELKDGLEAYVPEEVINYVESGKNPDIFTQTFVERAASENQFTNGKIKAVDNFRNILSNEFLKSFPELSEEEYDFSLQSKPVEQ
ncbi:transcription factor subunit Med10 of mediator complex-domain-containing protein [Phycomyces nitens]|nr:transcription factor subunit Med10 of mediator complex-domain-containing protein [Phycomyces nitens]